MPEANNISELTLKFTKEMVIPEDMQKKTGRSLDSEESFVSLELIPIDEESSQSFLVDWTVVSIDSESIKVKLQFEQPLEVSQTEEPDILFIRVNLRGLQDVDGMTWQGELYQLVALPKQFESKEQQIALAKVRDTVEYSSKSTWMSNWLVQLIMSASAN